MAKPKERSGNSHGIALSDDFSTPAFGTRWSFYKPRFGEHLRARLEKNSLVLSGGGTSPTDSAVLTGLTGDHAYEVTVEVETASFAQGGLLLFYSNRLYCGMGHNGSRLSTYRSGLLSFWPEPGAPSLRRIYMRIVNDHHIVTMYYSANGSNWTRHGLRMETSGYNTNTIGDLLSLRPPCMRLARATWRFAISSIGR